MSGKVTSAKKLMMGNKKQGRIVVARKVVVQGDFIDSLAIFPAGPLERDAQALAAAVRHLSDARSRQLSSRFLRGYRDRLTNATHTIGSQRLEPALRDQIAQQQLLLWPMLRRGARLLGGNWLSELAAFEIDLASVLTLASGNLSVTLSQARRVIGSAVANSEGAGDSLLMTRSLADQALIYSNRGDRKSAATIYGQAFSRAQDAQLIRSAPVVVAALRCNQGVARIFHRLVRLGPWAGLRT